MRVRLRTEQDPTQSALFVHQKTAYHPDIRKELPSCGSIHAVSTANHKHSQIAGRCRHVQEFSHLRSWPHCVTHRHTPTHTLTQIVKHAFYSTSTKPYEQPHQHSMHASNAYKSCSCAHLHNIERLCFGVVCAFMLVYSAVSHCVLFSNWMLHVGPGTCWLSRGSRCEPCMLCGVDVLLSG